LKIGPTKASNWQILSKLHVPALDHMHPWQAFSISCVLW
jgi:hypothetical protein